MKPADTGPEAHAAQIAFYRRIGGARRLELGIRMSDEIREVTMDGIRARHPEYTEDDVRLALYRLMLGDGLFSAAWPAVMLLDP